MRSGDFIVQFEENLLKARTSERAFLLTAFAKMAACRDPVTEKEFIKAAALDIFQVGFILEGTEELNLSKEAGDQLANICATHPFVMSLIVKKFCGDGTDSPRLEVY